MRLILYCLKLNVPAELDWIWLRCRSPNQALDLWTRASRKECAEWRETWTAPVTTLLYLQMSKWLVDKLDKYLSFVHLDQAFVDFGPGRNGADVPKLVRVFRERAGFDLGNEVYRAQEHVLLRVRFNDVGVEEVTGFDAAVSWNVRTCWRWYTLHNLDWHYLWVGNCPRQKGRIGSRRDSRRRDFPQVPFGSSTAIYAPIPNTWKYWFFVYLVFTAGIKPNITFILHYYQLYADIFCFNNFSKFWQRFL